MKFINLGPLHMPLDLVVIAFATFFSVLILKFFLQRFSLPVKKILDELWNGIFILIAVWKFSIIIFDFKLVIESPISLLYFTGGEKGIWLGLAVAIFYMLWKARMLHLSILGVPPTKSAKHTLSKFRHEKSRFFLR